MKRSLRFRSINVGLCIGACVLASDVSAKTWAEKCTAVNFICLEIQSVSSDGKTVTIDRDPILLSNFPSTVVWRIPEGYVFNFKNGGASIPHQGEVTEAGGSDDDEGGTGRLTKRYRIKTKKLKQDYEYSLIFHEMNGGKPTRRFDCDPRIANFGGLHAVGKQQASGQEAAKVASVTLTCVVQDEP